jgi:two-component system, NarL family, response regulator NreC
VRTYRVLVVDDHEIFRTGLKTLLERNPDYKVVGEAANGQEAVEKAANLQPDVVLMDIVLPGMNGLEASRQILINLPRTQVIVLSAHESETMAQEAFKAGVYGYVVKSAASRDVVLALECLRRKAPFFSSKGTKSMVLQAFDMASERARN